MTLLSGLVIWSCFASLMGIIPLLPAPVTCLIALRCGLGLGQAVIMPSVSATAAQSFHPLERGDKTSGIYACYSLGTVCGLFVTPVLADIIGWSRTFGLFGLVGLALGLSGWLQLRNLTLRSEDSLSTTKLTSRAIGHLPQKSQSAGLIKHTADMALLCWTHAVIGFGFFVLQAWVPTFLYSLGTSNLKTLGFLSAVPWLLTAITAAVSGKISQFLQVELRWDVLQIRRLMQVISSLGGALSLFLLAIQASEASPLLATFALSTAIGFQGFCYPGYHAYVQDVARADAGLVLAMTNTCSIAAGIIGNVITGHMAASPSGFGAVFGLTAFLYFLSTLTWLTFARGGRIRLAV